MHPSTFFSALDNMMFGVPLLALLIFGYFRLDEVMKPKKPSLGALRHMRPVTDPADRSLLTDPDGRPWD